MIDMGGQRQPFGGERRPPDGVCIRDMCGELLDPRSDAFCPECLVYLQEER